MKKKILNFSIILSNTTRSLSYLRYLKKYKLLPNLIFYLNDKKNFSKKYETFFIKFSKKYNIDLVKLNSDTVDRADIIKLLLNSPYKFIIYSGYPGKIIKSKKLIKNKNFLHSHPGKLPNFKGSTTIFYSLIATKKIFCTTFILSGKLDGGQIILINEYTAPKKISEINGVFDDKIRSINMVKAIKKIQSRKFKKKKVIINSKYKEYSVAHPLIRAMAIKNVNKQL